MGDSVIAMGCLYFVEKILLLFAAVYRVFNFGDNLLCDFKDLAHFYE